MVVGCQSYAPAAFTPTNIPGTHFHNGLSRSQGHGLVGRKYVTEKSSDNTGYRSRSALTTTLPQAPALVVDGWNINIEHRWNDTERETPKYSERNQRAIFCPPQIPSLGSNTSLKGEEPETNQGVN